MIKNNLNLSIGISVADYSSIRGHIENSVYSEVDHLEYSGFFPPRQDRGMQRIFSELGQFPTGRHLVSTSLPEEIDPSVEAVTIQESVDGIDASYFLTDAEFWLAGGRQINNLWPRPCILSKEACNRIISNHHSINKELGKSVMVENSALVFVDGDLTPAEFMLELADGGLNLCFDVGHFYAACINSDFDLDKELDRVPFEAIRICHIAGLSPVEYNGKYILLDNHHVTPLDACMLLLEEVVSRASNLSWITYEAELASTSVQLTGLRELRRLFCQTKQ